MSTRTVLAGILSMTGGVFLLVACTAGGPAQDNQRPRPPGERAGEAVPTPGLTEWGDTAALGEAANRGQLVFNGPGQCTSCHTLFDEGVGTASELSSMGFTLDAQAKQNDESVTGAFRALLAAHPNAAAVRARMSDQEVADLAAFLFTLRNPPDLSATAALPTPVLAAPAEPTTLALAPVPTDSSPVAAPAVGGEPTAEPEPEAEAERETTPMPAPTPAQERAIRSTITLAPNLQLRARPSISAVRVRSLPMGAQLDVLAGAARADGFRWVRVRTADGTVGWVIANAVR